MAAHKFSSIVKHVTLSCLLLTPNPRNPTHQPVFSPWQLRISPTPSGAIFPTTHDEIATGLACADEVSVKVAARNGGHSDGSYGQGGNDGALVIHMDAFQDTSFHSSTGLLTYGGDSIVGDVVTWVWENHGVHFPPRTSKSRRVGWIVHRWWIWMYIPIPGYADG